MNFSQRFFLPLVLLSSSLVLTACSEPEEEVAEAPPRVSYLQLEPTDVTPTQELVGRVVADRTAEIRPQVGGIVVRRMFEQGTVVKAGQPLFQIDPAPFKADLQNAAAAVNRAEAAYHKSRTQAERLVPLVAAEAISQQTLDDAIAARDQAAADVAEAKATESRRRLDLNYSTVRAPIDGRIGEELVTEGALVSTADSSPMARIQQTASVYVDVRQPSSKLRQLQDAVSQEATTAEIVDGEGHALGLDGQILFSGINVDPGTGDVVVRIRVKNPSQQLLPGQFVRARLPLRTATGALMVPQQAVIHGVAAASQVWVLDLEGKAHMRSVSLGHLVNGQYLINSGLAAGERVIVEGLERLQPEMPVDAKLWLSDEVADHARASVEP